jgi:hypothetical protein
MAFFLFSTTVANVMTRLWLCKKDHILSDEDIYFVQLIGGAFPDTVWILFRKQHKI